MACSKEQRRYNDALSRLRGFERELETAPTSRKAAIVRKIEAQQRRVDAAAAELEDCRRRHAPPPPPPPPQSQTPATLVKVRLQSSYEGLHFWEEPEKPAEGIRTVFQFKGTDSRTWVIPDFDIRRRFTDPSGSHTTVYLLTGLGGTLQLASGAMTLRGTLKVTKDDAPQGDPIGFDLQTGSASSRKLLFEVTLTGHPLDGTSVLMVGAGTAGTVAWGLEIDVLFDAPP